MRTHFDIVLVIGNLLQLARFWLCRCFGSITIKEYFFFTFTATKSPIHHSETRTVIIVSGTTGAILAALIILVVIVSCQRRLHYHRMRRARLRHRQDQEAFTAFITYHRDARLMLPSYDEAMNQQEHGQPPSFEEALRHYEEPTLPPGHTPAGESPRQFQLTPQPHLPPRVVKRATRPKTAARRKTIRSQPHLPYLMDNRQSLRRQKVIASFEVFGRYSVVEHFDQT